MKLCSAFAIALTVFIAPLGMAQNSPKTENKPKESSPASSKSTDQGISELYNELSGKLQKITKDVEAVNDKVGSEFSITRIETQSKFAEIKRSLDEVKTSQTKVNEVKASQEDVAKRIDKLALDFEALRKGLSSQAKKPDSTSDTLIPWIGGLIFTLIIVGVIWYRTKEVRPYDVHKGVDTRAVAEEVTKALSEKLSALAKINDLVRSNSELKVALSSMQLTLPQAVGKAAADEVSKSQVGDLKVRLVDLQSQLDTASSQASANQQAQARANASAVDADRAKHQAITELDDTRESLRHSEATAAQLLQELDAKARQIEQANDDVYNAQKLSQAAQDELRLTLEVNVPPGITDPVVTAQMQALHREAIQGNGPSVIAWATLCSFSAAAVDPSSKDFLLHALKRLGSVLVNYWKAQEGSTAKDRHEKLAHWAKCLSEHAQGRFSLIVPPLGSPVNKAAMATAGNVTVVQEVLTWQVRNPAGATFSLAEIA